MKVLVVKLSSMGDIISTLPALTDAKKVISHISFDWVVEESFVEIPAWHQAVSSIIPIALRRWRKKPLALATLQEIRAFWHRLRTEQYDYLLDVQGLLKSAIVAKIARGVSYGFDITCAREPLATYFYHHKFNIPKSLHAVERSRQLFAAALGYQIPANQLDYGLNKAKLGNHGDNAAAKYLVFVHGTSRSNKCWQESKWIELARLANNAGFKVKLPWGNLLELNRAHNIAKASANAEVLPKSTLTEIREILLGAKGVIALDTGLSHLSAALSVPAITLYGPTNPQLAGTYGKNQSHLINMENLSAQAVWQKFSSLLA